MRVRRFICRWLLPVALAVLLRGRRALTVCTVAVLLACSAAYTAVWLGHGPIY